MKVTDLLISAAAIPLTSAITLGPRTENPRVLSLDFSKRSIPDIIAHDRRRFAKRASTVSATLDNAETLYYANITLGTPGQSIALSIDTGSSDLWVNSASSSLCSSGQDECIGGAYDQSSSSSAKVVNNDFNISYVDGSGATGDYLSDILVFGGVTLDNFQFGLGENSESSQGVLGIGYATNEVQVNRAGGEPYPNLPQALVNDGYINKNAYSLWLNDLDASSGTILFGGVNTAKYTGNLVSVPILQEYGGYYELLVALSGMSFNGQAISSSSLPAAVLLDSGTSLIYLPNDITENIYNQVDVLYDAQGGVAYGYCSDANQDKSITFTFSGQSISVPFNELFLDAGTDQNGNPLTFKNGQSACIFGISPADGSTPLLGDVFLRSAYVVYDLQDNEIALAQTVFNSTNDDVVEITNSTSIPGATAAANPVTSVVNAATGGARLGGASSTNYLGGNPSGAVPNAEIPWALAGIVLAGIISGAALL